MKDTAIALYNFFSSFGLPAFVENNVPDEMPINGIMAKVEPPYITYDLVEPESLENTALKARIWYIDTGFQQITEKVDEIRHATKNGISLPTGNGAIWMWKDTKFCQFQPADEPKLKIAYLSFVMGSYKE